MAWEPDYVTLDEYKIWARIADNDTDDESIQSAITTASRSIDKFCSQHVPRQFGKTVVPEVRYYTPRWDMDLLRWVIEVDDLPDDDPLTITVDTSNSDVYNETITDYVLRPRDAFQKERPFTQVAISSSSSVQPTYFPDSVKIMADSWGWASVPVPVKNAAYLQTNRYHKRRSAPFKETGSTNRGTQITLNLINELDEDIETMLQPYVKQGWTL